MYNNYLAVLAILDHSLASTWKHVIFIFVTDKSCVVSHMLHFNFMFTCFARANLLVSLKVFQLCKRQGMPIHIIASYD
jgi:hypothetical protein